MSYSKFLSGLNDFQITAEPNVPLAKYCTFKIGGNADYIVMPKDIMELTFVLKMAIKAEVDYCIFGNGSNFLISDSGYRGVVILTKNIKKITIDDNNIVTCEAGANISKLCNFLLTRSLAGFEFAYGIPGTIGGGVYMNAGAYGSEFSDFLVSCDYLDKEDLIVKTINVEDMELSYRHSFFTGKKLLILSAKFQFKPGKKDEILSNMNRHMDARKKKQPLDYPSAGSTFKRPKVGFASAMIDECDLKGYRVGGAEVSPKHAGFVVNCGDGTASDVIAVIKHVQEVVRSRKRVDLETEVELLGEF